MTARGLSEFARREDGWVLVIAIVLMTVMLSVALASFAYVDAQQRQSAVGRQRNTAFNLAEAAMNAQIFALQQDWPGVGRSAPGERFDPCDQTSPATDPHCPNAARLTSLFTSPDTTPTTVWQTSVRDNVGSATDFYSDALTATAPGYDSNHDNRLWVRAQATAKGRTRAMVALVTAQKQTEDIPRAALISGRLTITNYGKKVLIDAQGGSAVTGIVAVRCHVDPASDIPCLGHPLGTNGIQNLADLTKLLDAQISPDLTQQDYAGGNAMTDDAQARLMAAAIADDKYYDHCPADLAALSGQVVYIDTTATCAYQQNGQVNTPDKPGIIIMARGVINLYGTNNIWGIIYHENKDRATGNLVYVQGGAVVHGGVLIDGDGTMVAGSSNLNIQIDSRGFNAVQSYGSAGIVQNTWREIKAP
ncbi:MAG: hypothetical protein M3296_03715 [Actinomycetota bacterium]|nr:hypothetical protein [Actinomycetota bacterium]